MSRSRPAVLYHWAPRERRGPIERRGLRVGRLSRDGAWRPGYVCFGTDPAEAWRLSGAMCGILGETWDLWLVWTVPEDRLRRRGDWPTEVRIHSDVPKRRVWRVGERTIERTRGRNR